MMRKKMKRKKRKRKRKKTLLQVKKFNIYFLKRNKKKAFNKIKTIKWSNK